MMEPQTTGLNGRQVLVVEDNSFLSMVLEDTLRTAGCIVIGPFARLRDALAVVDTTRIDAAVLDVNLRGEVVSPLVAQLQKREIPMLLTSAYARTEMPEVLRGLDQLRKPFTDTDLLDSLAKLIAEPRKPQ